MISLSAFHILYRLLTTYVKYEIRYALRRGRTSLRRGPYLTKYYGTTRVLRRPRDVNRTTFVFLKRDAESPHVS